MKKLSLLLPVSVSAALCITNAFAARPNPDSESVTLDEPQTVTIEQETVVAPDAPDAPDIPEKPFPPGDGKTRREVREIRIAPHSGLPAGQGANPFMPMTADRLSTIVKRVGGPGAGRPFVVRSSEVDSKEEANLEEDMGVMAHLLEKTAGASGVPTARGSSAMGIDLFFKPGAGGMHNLYLEGYGAVFTLNVGFPLMASGKGQGEKEKTSSDSEWESARQEVLGQGGEDHLSAAPVEAYDEQRVNKLKDSILESLKNASNIRGLKSDEFVTVCVVGAPTAGGGRVQTTRRAVAGGKGEEVIVRKEGGAPAMRSMLTIRVHKGDAEAFAKDKMNLDDFRKKARITTYAAGAAEGGMGGIMNFGAGGGAGGGGNNFNYEVITR